MFVQPDARGEQRQDRRLDATIGYPLVGVVLVGAGVGAESSILVG